MEALSRALIDRFQRDMPLTERPYLSMARALGATEAQVIDALTMLRQEDIVSRVGPVFDHARAGASMLVAAAVPAGRLEAVAERISAFDCVNHNYAREHRFNLWFVATAPDLECLDRELSAMERAVGIPLLRLPMEKSYHIDLGFDIHWPDAGDGETPTDPESRDHG